MAAALFLGGFTTFGLLYCVQPMLPEFSRQFGVGPAESSLALSLSTGFLAIAIVLAGAGVRGFSRRGLMFTSMLLASALNLCAAMAPGWTFLLAARAFEGFLLGGVPAVAMAYVSEEMEPRDLGAAMGLYVAGTAFGGMAGRIGTGLLMEVASWHVAMAIVGVAGLLSALAFFALLPPQRHPPAALSQTSAASWREALARPGLMPLFVIAFCLMGLFVTMFNYAGFRLELPPYLLGQAEISLIFVVYALGMFGSSVAGRLSDRWGRRPILFAGLGMVLTGLALTLSGDLRVIIGGIACLTAGFFVSHSVASGWVGALSGRVKGQAAALYLLFYYAGSSLAGSAGGWFWQHGAWAGVALFGFVLTGIAVVLAGIVREQAAG